MKDIYGLLRRAISVADEGKLLSLSTICSAASISAREANARVGESVMVEGTVAQVFTSDRDLLNFGRP